VLLYILLSGEALVELLLPAPAIGFILGYGVREIISRRRRAAAEDRFRDELSSDTLPHLEWEIGRNDGALRRNSKMETGASHNFGSSDVCQPPINLAKSVQALQ